MDCAIKVVSASCLTKQKDSCSDTLLLNFVDTLTNTIRWDNFDIEGNFDMLGVTLSKLRRIV